MSPIFYLIWLKVYYYTNFIGYWFYCYLFAISSTFLLFQYIFVFVIYNMLLSCFCGLNSFILLVF